MEQASAHSILGRFMSFYCSEHGINYSSSRCPRCEADERTDRLEEALRGQSEAAQERLEEVIQEQRDTARETADRYINPGEYICPHCLFRTLKSGSTRCVKCHGTIGSRYWEEVREREAKERAAAEDRARVARQRAEEAAAAQRARILEVERRNRAEAEAQNRFNGCLVAIFTVVMLSLGLFGYLHNKRSTTGEGTIPAGASAVILADAVRPESPTLSSLFVDPKDLIGSPRQVRMMIDSLCYSDTVTFSSASGRRVSSCRTSGILARMGASQVAQLVASELERSVWGVGDWVPVRLVSHGPVSELFVADLMSNAGEVSWLVNGRPSFVRIDVGVNEAIAAAARHPEWQRFFDSLPHGAVPTTWLSAPVFLRSERHRDAEQRLIFSQQIIDGCHACPELGTIEFGFDVTTEGQVVRKVITNVVKTPSAGTH